MKRAVVVGATGGIGRAVAEAYAARGWWVGVVGRDAEAVDEVVAALRASSAAGRAEGAVCDVRDDAEVEAAFETVVRRLGQLDHLVYCAGAMADEGSAEGRLRAADELMAVNVRGAVGWLERGAEHLVGRGMGRLGAVGSVAGDRGRKGAPVYGASKAALHQYLEGLRHRLHGTGVGVTTLKPGWVRTRMLDEETAGSPLAVSPERAARIVVGAMERGKDAVYVPWYWGLVSLALRLMPRPLYVRLAPP